MNTPQRKILETLFPLGLSVAEQITRGLSYSDASLPYVQRNIKPLKTDGYLTVVNKHHPRGLPDVLALTNRGHKFLKRAGFPVPPRFTPIVWNAYEESVPHHIIAANEFFIAAKNLENATVLDHRNEFYFRTNPLVTTYKEEQIIKRPDWWVRLKMPSDTYAYGLEMELSELEQKRLRKKIRDYTRIMPAYEERFGTNDLTVVFVIGSKIHYPKSAKRRDDELLEREEVRRRKILRDYLSWTEAELRELGLESDRDMFLFTDRRINTMEPQELFYGRHFFMPFSDKPEPLILSGKEGNGGWSSSTTRVF